MNTAPAKHHFYVWAPNATVHGPLELPALVEQTQSQRLQSDMWVYAAGDHTWQRARDVPELRMFFG